MDTFWTIFFFIGKVSLLALAAFPLFLVGLAVYKIYYRQKRVQQADEVILLREAWHQFSMDPHGLSGVVVNLLEDEVGKLYCLDNGEWVPAAHKLAALSGAQGYSAVATQVVEEEAPMVQLPSLVSTHDLQAPKDADL